MRMVYSSFLKSFISFAAAGVVAFALALPIAATAAEIGKGDPARAEILQAIQPFVEWAAGREVILSAARIRVVGDWAHVRARVLRLDGAPVASDEIRLFGPVRAPVTTSAILRLRQGRWLIVDGAFDREDDRDPDASWRRLRPPAGLVP